MGLVKVVMMHLWSLVLFAVLTTGSFGEEFDEHPVESDTPNTGSTAGQSLKCPGVCQAEPCVTFLDETDCSDGMTCCLDNLEKITDTEFAESEFTTESLLDSNTVKEVYEISEETVVSDNVDFDMFSPKDQENADPSIYGESEVKVDIRPAATSYPVLEEIDEGDGPNYGVPEITELDGRRFSVEQVGDYKGETDPVDYAMLYVDDSSQSASPPYFSVSTQEAPTEDELNCPGRCTPADYLSECKSFYSDTTLCPYGTVCCFEDPPLNRFRVPFGRSSDQMQTYDCPGSCMHPSHMMYCERVLPQFSCPLNSKCCMLSTQRAPTQDVTVCTGTCLPFHMSGYCLPPSEIVMGSTNCEQGTSCCMKNPRNVLPPRFKAMTFPSQHSSYSNSDVTSNLLGHLAVDDAGTVFKVSKNGQISTLKNLPLGISTQNLVRLATYPRINGDILIYSSPTGDLFQQFVPRQETQNSRSKPLRQLVQQFDPQATEMSTSLKPNFAEKEKPVQTDVNRDAVMDIVIPDDDDEAPVTKNSPLVHTDKSSRPQCPGSCMSYFLRFTCFRGYAIYDGFTCPGRAVCCARLQEIEEHEQYLKSLSPYFNAPPASRDSTLPRCGLKGRRDTPRIMGGKDALSGEWCWQVAIINVQNQYVCGGALIDNSWVLTAAHCVVTSLEEGQALFIRAGVTDLKSQEDNSKAQTIRVLSIFIHHNFNSRNLDNNIALLRLQKPVELSSNVCVVCLPTNKMMPADGTKCTVTGYGFISPDGGMSLRIREASVPIVDDIECMTNVTEALDHPFIIPSSSFCAGGAGVEDACQGDAGGALACEVSGFHELIGLVSWGLGCGKDYVPSIYVKIPSFMGWINQIISSSSFVLPSTQI